MTSNVLLLPKTAGANNWEYRETIDDRITYELRIPKVKKETVLELTPNKLLSWQTPKKA